MGAKTSLVVAAMTLLFTFSTAPFVVYDEMAGALGVTSPGTRSRRVGPAFGERLPSLHVTMDRGRVVVDAEVTHYEEKNRLITRAGELYGREQFVDLVAVVPDLRPSSWTSSVEAALPPFSAMSPGSYVTVKGQTMQVKLAFPDAERRQKYLGQAETLKRHGLTLVVTDGQGARK